MPADTLLDRLEGVRSSGHGRWIARCPAHDDRSPSLSIRELDDGRTLIHCHAGCGASDVVAAVGLAMTDLFPDGPLYIHAKCVRRRGEQRAYCESLVEIAANVLREGKRLTREDIAALKSAKQWIATHPEVMP